MMPKIIDTTGFVKALKAINKRKSNIKHPHVTSVLPDLPVGAITTAAWTDDIVTDYLGNIWLKCNGQEIDVEMYPELVGSNGIEIVPKKVHPNMTSNTAPSPYVITESSFASPPVKDGWNAFNGLQDGSEWCSLPTLPQWIKIDMGARSTIDGYTIKARGSNNGWIIKNFPKKWIVQGSNDDINWDTIDSQSNIIDVLEVVYYPKIFKLADDVNYRYYQIIVSELINNNQTTIGEIEFTYSTQVISNLPKINGNFQYIKATNNQIYHNHPIGWLKVLACNDEVLYAHDGEWLRCDGREIDIEEYPELAGSNIIEAYFKKVTENMTSNDTPSPFVVSASSQLYYFGTISYAYFAFNGVSAIDGADTSWLSAFGTFNTSLVGNQWLMIDCGSSRSINKYIIRCRHSAPPQNFPSNFTLEGSDDEINWDTIDTRTGVTTPSASYDKRSFDLDQIYTYRYYRLVITKVGALTNSGSTYVAIGELELYGPEPTYRLLNKKDGTLYTYVKANNKGFEHPVE